MITLTTIFFLILKDSNKDWILYAVSMMKENLFLGLLFGVCYTEQGL